MQKKKAISLIVLVITIIVMIILAGAIILSLNNSGIIDKANKAVEETNAKLLQEMVTSELILNGWTTGQDFTNNHVDIIEKALNESEVELLGTDTLIVTQNGTTITIYNSGEMVVGKNIWDGTSSKAPEIKEGNWYIYTPSELKFLADFVNNGSALTEQQKTLVASAGFNEDNYVIGDTTTVYLMADLDLGARQKNGTKTSGTQWTPIGTTEDLKFTGTFEGNNNVIRGVYVFETSKGSGVFGNSDTIKNLTVKDSYVRSDEGGVGAVVGVLREGDIINCHNVNTEVVGAYSVGGVIGQMDSINITNCTNTGNITSGKYENDISGVGGIVGVTHDVTIVDDCENFGKVTGAGDQVGGIVGEAWSGTEIKNCRNKGEVTGVKSTGGIAGLCFGSIIKCYNTGIIVGTSDELGGITGVISAFQSDTTQKIVEKCFNTGKIIQKGSNTNYVGGIVGLVSHDNVIVNNNYNIGEIEIEGSEVTDVGGAIGYVITSETVVSSNNYYLDSSVTENGSHTSGTSKTSAEMKNATFVTLLNTGLANAAWEQRKGENSDYPVLIGLK